MPNWYQVCYENRDQYQIMINYSGIRLGVRLSILRNVQYTMSTMHNAHAAYSDRYVQNENALSMNTVRLLLAHVRLCMKQLRFNFCRHYSLLGITISYVLTGYVIA